MLFICSSTQVVSSVFAVTSYCLLLIALNSTLEGLTINVAVESRCVVDACN